MRILYGLLFSIFSIFYLPIFLIKGKGRGGLGSRLGRVDAETRAALEGRKVVWVHAVSVGEVALALRLIGYWRALVPGAKFVLTVTTVAGLEVAKKTKGADDVLLQFPADFRFAVRRFLDGVKPAAVVFMETEIWPNLAWELSARKIPFFIMNGRISDRAIGKYRRVRFFLAPVLRLFTAIAAQDELMRKRFVELGADARKVAAAGNLKFDWQPSARPAEGVREALQRMAAGPSFLVLAASTHDGEDGILMDAFLSLRGKIPGVELLLAPRHLERIPAVEALAETKGIALKKVFTEANNGYDGKRPAVWLLDRMGVLQHLYPAASAVFVGGSLVPVGGHNPVEPAYYGKPVLFGPRMENFQEMSRIFTESGAAFVVTDARSLEDRLLYLARDRESLVRTGERAKAVLREHQGALEKSTRLFRDSTQGIWQ